MDDKNSQKKESSEPRSVKKIEHYVFSYAYELGAGSFSKVFKGVDTRDNSTVAIKIVQSDKITTNITKTLLAQEIEILKQLSHENVIRCLDVFNSLKNCYIVTEFCQYGDLAKLIQAKKKFAQDEISTFVYQIYKGLKYLREIGVVHRDLKTANIFVAESGICKIADFGFAIKASSEFTDISLGSPLYMAPEAIYQRKYNCKTDVWAFGIIIYELVCGKVPLAGVKTKEQLMQKVFLPIIMREEVSGELNSFINRCLTVQPEHRISIEEMQSHQYIRKLMVENQPHKFSGSTSLMDSESFFSEHPSKSSKLIHRALQHPLLYEQAVSLLQYCRLLSRVCSCVKSDVLEQWLLNMIYNVHKAKLKQNQLIDYAQYRETVALYYNRYYKQFKDRGARAPIDAVLKECEVLLEKNRKYHLQLTAITSETMLLSEALSHPLRYCTSQGFRKLPRTCDDIFFHFNISDPHWSSTITFQFIYQM